jgi:hypothetical protein
MSFLSGKHLSRRTFVRGAGASFAVPFLDAMVPAGRAWRDPAQTSFTRMVCIEESHGCAGGNNWGDTQHLFAPAKIGKDFEIAEQSQLRPLTPFRDYLTVVSDTDCRMGEPWETEEIGADHRRTTSVFLTQAHPKRTQSADIYLGKSIDQIHAGRYGRDTVLPSLEITTEGFDAGGQCAGGYSCAYGTCLAWASPNQPLPAIREPRAVFEALFGAGDTVADRAARLRTNRSLLDWVLSEMADLKRELAPVDRRALDEYTTHIREVERRIQLVEAQSSSGEQRAMPEAPSGIPDTWEEHMQLMFDLQVLALQADLTRVITFKTGTDLSNATFPASGTNGSFHGLSHHGEVPAKILEFNVLNTHRLGQMAYFLEKLKGTVEGDASLLDKTVVVWGSAMGDPNLHNHVRCPLLLIGRANGALEGNLHLRAPRGTPMANAFVNLMQRLGHDDLREFGDSTGEFSLTAPSRAASSSQGGGA